MNGELASSSVGEAAHLFELDTVCRLMHQKERRYRTQRLRLTDEASEASTGKSSSAVSRCTTSF